MRKNESDDFWILAKVDPDEMVRKNGSSMKDICP
jgi:hypothetical protein